MANDLVTRLTMEIAGYQSNLAKASGETLKFKKSQEAALLDVKKSFQTIQSTVMGVGAAIGVAMGSKEAFDKFISSSQTTSDAFGREVDVWKSTVDSFFIHLNRGDGFSSFIKQLGKVKEAAKHAFDMQDILDDMKLSDTVIDAQTRAEGERYRTDYKKAKAVGDTEGMRTAQENYTALMEKYYVETIRTQNQTLGTAISNVNKYLEQSGLDFQATQEDILTFATRTNKEDPRMKEVVNTYDARIKELDNRISAGTLYTSGSSSTIYTSGVPRKELTADAKKAQQEKDAYIKANRFAAIQSRLFQQPDAQRTQLFGQLASYYNLEQSYQQFRGAGARLDQGVANLPAFKSEAIPEKVTTPVDIEDFSDEENLKGSIEDLIMGMEGNIFSYWVEASQEARATALKKLTELDSGVDVEMNPISPEMLKVPDISKNLDWSAAMDSVSGISSMVSSMAAMTDNASASWMSYAANIITGVAAMLPALASLIGIEAALGISEQAKIPFPLNIVAMATTGAALAASLASIPKFATGGIVPGSSYTGDRVPALVNSGEMILNAGQQANLFNLINGGGGVSGGGGGVYEIQIHGSMLTAAFGVTNKRRRL